MPPDDSQKLTAALNALESERERRIEVRVDEGKAIREPLIVVSGDSEGLEAKVESARASRLAELRGNGERGEVVFDQTTIITGVPRSAKGYAKAESQPRDDYKPDYGSHLKTYGTKPPPPRSKPPPAAVPPPDPQHVRTEVRSPSDDGKDPGQIVEGYFDVRGGEVYVWTVAKGARPLGHAPVRPGDAPAVIARRILREKKSGTSGFYGAIQYPSWKVH